MTTFQRNEMGQSVALAQHCTVRYEFLLIYLLAEGIRTYVHTFKRGFSRTATVLTQLS